MLIDANQRYCVKGWRGVAFRFAGYPRRWEPEFCNVLDDEGQEYEVESGGEWVDDTDSGRVLMVMVGDDYKHTVDKCDLTLLSDDEYCRECGQIGCTADGRA